MFMGNPIRPRDSMWRGGDKSNNDIHPLGLRNQSRIQSLIQSRSQVRSEPRPAGRSLRLFALPQQELRAYRVDRTGA
jgi:hypothetical protein